MRAGVRHIAVQAHYLVAISKHGGFRPAADSCGVSPGAVSAGIHKLEQILKKQLVIAESDGARLTDEGLEILPECRRLVAANRSILDYAEEA